jgi:hypothetical protein
MFRHDLRHTGSLMSRIITSLPGSDLLLLGN